MGTVDLVSATIKGMSRLLQSREVSPVEITQATLDRIDRWNTHLNGYTTVTHDYALKRAREVEHEISRGKYRGPLHGIPYSLKDLIDTQGIRTTYGYSSHDDYIPSESARVYTLMEEAGGILVGKVNCHFRRDVPVQCFNPWDVTRSPGHSSAGSGLAVAASLGLASIGSDTGGSVRIPAAWSGVVGMRASMGLISRHNLFGPSWSFDQAGPLARTVEDTAILLQVLAGHDPLDPISLFGPVPDYQQALPGGIKGVRVGVIEDLLGGNCNEEVELAVRSAVDVMADLGAVVSNVSIPNLSDVTDMHNTIVEPESAVYYREVFPKERLDKIDPDMVARLRRGSEISMSEYLGARKKLARLKREVDQLMREVDVIVSPTTLTPPLKIHETKGIITIRGKEVNASSLTLKCTATASDTGLPSISVPCGFTDGRLPIGLHIMGRSREEGLLLRVAYTYEQSTDWHRWRPPLD